MTYQAKNMDKPKLAASSLADVAVPGDWQAVIEHLIGFEDALARSKESETPSEKLHALHQKILAVSSILTEHQSLNCLSERASEEIFVKAAVLSTNLHAATAGKYGILDTSSSRTLSFHAPDFSSDCADSSSLKTLLKKIFKTEEKIWSLIDTDTNRRLEQTRRKEAITNQIRSSFNLDPSHPQFRTGIYSLFTTFFANTGVTENEVEIVLSGSSITFCIPFKDNELLTERFRTADSRDRQATTRFLKNLNAFKQKYFARFPAFGYFDDNAVPQAFLEEISARTGLHANDVLSELHSMVMILPLTEVDKYIVHDLWGHGWQASLFDFEEMYKKIAQYHLPFTLDTNSPRQGQIACSFRDCFQNKGSNFYLEESVFTEFVHSLIAERIPVAMSPVLAEMLADVVEFKFLKDHPALIDDMPSSSLFKFMPTKLDFLLNDIKFYFGQATKAFRCLSPQSKHRPALIAELLGAGASETAAKEALDHAHHIWLKIEEKSYRKNIASTQNGQIVHTNVYTKLVLNFLSIHRAIAQTDEDLNSLGTSDLPLSSWRDLTVVALALFFEENRQENLWRLDEFLALRFKEHCLQLLKLSRS